MKAILSSKFTSIGSKPDVEGFVIENKKYIYDFSYYLHYFLLKSSFFMPYETMHFRIVETNHKRYEIDKSTYLNTMKNMRL